MNTGRPMVLVLAAAVGFVPVPAAGELLPAPFQIDGVERDLTGRFGIETYVIQVDLGAAAGKPVPSGESFRKMTVLGSSGASPAFLHDIRKVCEFLCGDEGEECHYVARVSPTRPLEEIGTPLAVIPGAHGIEAFRSFDVETAPAPSELIDEWLGRDFERPIWPTDPNSVLEYRLRESPAADRELGLEYRWSGGEVYSVEDRDCGVRRNAGLSELACSSFAMIAQEGRPLLVSLADYNSATAETVAAFESDGMAYRVVRLGLKAQTVIGLLVETESGWRAMIRPRDYGLLC
jgi:hypothetical protein